MQELSAFVLTHYHTRILNINLHDVEHHILNITIRSYEELVKF